MIQGPRVRHPSFATRQPGHPLAWALATLAAAIVLALTAEAGLWFVPFVLGLLAGLTGPRAGWRARRTLLAVTVAAAAGWAAPLWWSALRGWPVGATARVIAALAGLPAYAVTGIAATLLVAVLQGAVGLWLGWVLTPRRPANQ
ncbi:MAG TPA: hypothetical protein VGH27_02665 [Streptosporangiaceae bacterium]|jgi:hypothetical protein